MILISTIGLVMLCCGFLCLGLLIGSLVFGGGEEER